MTVIHSLNYRLTAAALLLLLSLASCSTSKPGSSARVTLSSDYPYDRPLRVLLVPVKVEGKPGMTTDMAATDAFAQRLLELGYKVIDWGQATSRAKDLGLSLSEFASEEDVMRVARQIGVDAVAKGRFTFGYSPGRAESGVKIENVSRTEIKKGTHRKDTVIVREDIPTNYSYSIEGSYYPASQSLNIISVPNGEIWLTAMVPSGPYDMSDELAHGIRRAVFHVDAE